MTEASHGPGSLRTNEKQLLLTEQARITNELLAKRDVLALPYKTNATLIVVPKVKKFPSFSLILKDESCHYKQLIFSALNAAHYRYFMTGEFTENRKERFIFARHLWDFLKHHTISKSNRALLFREFESWRVKEIGVKTQSTGLKWLNLLLQDALGLDEFASTLSQPDIDYLYSLSETRPAPSDEIDAINLNDWFTKQTWLRRDDLGVGHELYTRLSSPQMLMKSFRVTVENTLLHIQDCKDALIDLFRRAQVMPCAFPDTSPFKKNSELRREHQTNTLRAKESIFSIISDALLKLNERSAALDSSIELLVFSHCTPRFRADTLERLHTNRSVKNSINEKKCSVVRYNSLLNSGLFDCNFLRELATVAQDSQSLHGRIPVCHAEQLMFSWLMAYQTVQASDISKLTLSNFKFVRRVNGHITHIECDYWKGRANTIHLVNTLPTKDSLGRAVLRYIKDVTCLIDRHIPLTVPFKSQNLGTGNLIGRLMLFCGETSFYDRLLSKHQEQRVTLLFLNSMLALIRNGVNPKTQKAKREKCETLTAKVFFGLSQIKTSAVYSKSVTFDPTTLLNTHSHTDRTERKSYLTRENEDWLNRCGRITRAVMNDIATNVFRVSKANKALLESEFIQAFEVIRQRSEETLLRMKLVTEKATGRVDELGFITTVPLNTQDALPDALFLEDSPETVLKLMHYLAELERKHKALLISAPEFLFNTVLPTSEWIECLFDDKRFSEDSLKKGLAEYRRFEHILPPHFTSHIK